MAGDRHDYLIFEFDGLGAVRAKLLWDDEPELCGVLASSLPFKTIFSHAMATGQEIYAPTRIVGSTRLNKQYLLTELPEGSVTLSTDDYKTMDIYYGSVTEPLPAGGRVAQVVSEDLPFMKEVGNKVWYSNYSTHKPIIVNVRSGD